MTDGEKILLLIGLTVFSGVTTVFILIYTHKNIIAARDAFKELRKLKDKIKW